MRRLEDRAQRLGENYRQMATQISAVADGRPGAQEPSEQLWVAVLDDANALADAAGLNRPTNLMQVALVLAATR